MPEKCSELPWLKGPAIHEKRSEVLGFLQADMLLSEQQWELPRFVLLYYHAIPPNGCDYVHFTDEETKAWRDSSLAWGHRSWEWAVQHEPRPVCPQAGSSPPQIVTKNIIQAPNPHGQKGPSRAVSQTRAPPKSLIDSSLMFVNW